MSAIFGIVRRDDQDASPVEIGQMARRLAHRGRDGGDTIAFDCVALGSALHHVNVEDVHESQPLRDRERGLTMVADARLDNREALAAELGIAETDLATMPDSALLLACYGRWGEDCLDRILGDFVFAVWEKRTGALVLARDPMGQRGLYYHCGDAMFAFASEPKALWEVEGVPRRLSPTVMVRGLMAPMDSVPGATLFDGIATLPGGTVLRLDARSGLSLRTYWTPHADPAHLGKSEQYYADGYRKVMEEAVACRVRRLLRAPALAFSGGFDSGVIAAIAGPLIAAKGRKLVAVASVLSEGKERFTGDARPLVESYRRYPFMDLRFYERGEDTPFTDAETRFAQTDTPGVSYVHHGLYRIARDARCRLFMDGIGGDYTLHSRTRGLLGRMLIELRLGRFVREFRAARRISGASIWRVYRELVHPAFVRPRGRQWLHRLRRKTIPVWRNRPVNQVFAQSLIDEGSVDPARLIDSGAPTMRGRQWHEHMLRRVQQSLPVMQAAAGAHGLDFTRPFHDRRVVELALAIPEHLEFRGGQLRGFAREAFADRLPRELLQRKGGNLPMEPDRFRAATASLAGELDDARAREDAGASLSRYFDFDAVERLIADPDERNFADHRRLDMARTALLFARFAAWFDRSNR